MATHRGDIVERGQAFCEKGSRYSWNWEWLERDYVLLNEEGKEEFKCIYGNWIRKLTATGKAYCQLCKQELLKIFCKLYLTF